MLSTLTFEDKRTLLNAFPDIKLSYEKYAHKKVMKCDIVVGIPEGRKCFAWYTLFRDQYLCFLLELEPLKRAVIQHVHVATTCFAPALCYGGGTVLYGTLFHYKKNPFFSIEDIPMYKGNDLARETWAAKIAKMRFLLGNEIKQASYSHQFVVFGLPLMALGHEEFERKLASISYKLSAVHYRIRENTLVLPFDKYLSQEESPSTTTTYSEHLKKGTTVFLVRPDILNDVYHLYCAGGEYGGVAAIPDYSTSVFMNNLFRIIKENADLDKLEESDDEEEFENPNIDKFVHLDVSHRLECRYHKRHRKWIPLRVAHERAELAKLHDLQTIQK